LGTGNYLVSFPAGTVPFDGSDCEVLIPLTTIAGAAARFIGVERSSCGDTTGVAEFEVNTFDAAGTAVDSQFWFIAY
jgi:hypothetical protein